MLSITILRTDTCNPHGGRGKICMILLLLTVVYMLNRIEQIEQQLPSTLRELDLVTFHIKAEQCAWAICRLRTEAYVPPHRFRLIKGLADSRHSIYAGRDMRRNTR